MICESLFCCDKPRLKRTVIAHPPARQSEVASETLCKEQCRGEYNATDGRP